MIKINPISDLLDRKFPDQEYVIDRLIPAGGITILSGQASSYKTWILLEAALKVAAGEPLFGRFATSQAGVLILDEESGERQLHKRLKLLGADKELPVYYQSYEGFTLNDDNVDYIKEVCANNNIRLLIIDSLSRIHTGDENQSSTTSEIFKYLRSFSAAGIAVLIIHHHRKTTQNSRGNISQELRGNSDILASADIHIAVTRNENQITVTQTKQRLDPEIKPFVLNIPIDEEATSFTFELVGDVPALKDKNALEIKECIKTYLSLGTEATQSELLTAIKMADIRVNEHKLRTILLEMVKDGELDCRNGKSNTKIYSLRRDVDDV